LGFGILQSHFEKYQIPILHGICRCSTLTEYNVDSLFGLVLSFGIFQSYFKKYPILKVNDFYGVQPGQSRKRTREILRIGGPRWRAFCSYLVET